MTKRSKTKHISDFDSYKKICELKKNRSPVSILFCTNDFEDEWLIDVVEYRTKSGVVSDNYVIIAKDMKDYIKFCGNDGFNKLTKF